MSRPTTVPPHYHRKRLVTWLLVALLLVLVYFSAKECRVDHQLFSSGVGEGLRFLTELFPPDYSTFSEMLYPALETIMIALLATVLGALFSLAFALAGAANLAPLWLKSLSRLAMALERALPEIIVILLLVAALGLGPFPGVVALSIGCLGMLGRLFADAIEEVDAKTMEAVASVGATKAQIIRYVVLPQVMPSLIANTLFRLEINIRLSVLLGAVGAGGIGYEIFYSFQLLEYERASMAILVVLALVFFSERLSDFLRNRLIPEGKLK
ncbi:MAG: phosphonate ABC transporter, permease protein PhnE [Bacteroidota bacterium]